MNDNNNQNSFFNNLNKENTLKSRSYNGDINSINLNSQPQIMDNNNNLVNPHNSKNSSIKGIKFGKNIIPKIIITIIIAIFLIFLIKTFIGNSKEGNCYTAKYGQELNIYELNGKYNYSISVNSIEENQPVVITQNFAEKEYRDYTKIKVTVTNKSSTALSLSLTLFELLDSNNEIISTFHPFELYLDKDTYTGILDPDIPAETTISGYLYFENNNSDINLLKLNVPSSNTSNNGTAYLDDEDYFIKLK